MDADQLERAIALSKQHLTPTGASDAEIYEEQLARAIALSKAHERNASTKNADFLGASFRDQMRIEQQIVKERRKNKIVKNRRKSEIAKDRRKSVVRYGSYEFEDVHDKTCREEKEAMHILVCMFATQTTRVFRVEFRT